jgi:UDP:flavonoid glycosyltransferase YjiC (YdhE family)
MLNAERLAEAIRISLEDSTMRKRAEEIGVRIRAEDGVAKTLAYIQKALM